MENSNTQNIAAEEMQSITFSPKKIALVLSWAIFFLALGHIAAFIEDYVRHAYSRTAKNINSAPGLPLNY